MSDKRTRCWDVDLCCGDDLCRFQNGESMPRGVYCAKDDTAPPPAPADFRGVTTYPHDDPPGLADVMKKIPASANATPKRVVYAVRTDERTGRYAAAITRDGVDILHLHVGSDRNTAENVMLVVAALARFHLPVSATPAPDDAVEKAARAILDDLDADGTRVVREAHLAALRAALRREKGGA